MCSPPKSRISFHTEYDLANGCNGSEAASLPQIAWVAAVGQERPVEVRANLPIFRKVGIPKVPGHLAK